MEILCIECLHKAKRRALDTAYVFPCNHVLCPTHGAKVTSCPHCGTNGPGESISFNTLKHLTKHYEYFFSAPPAVLIKAARRALNFWEQNNRSKIELIACQVAYRCLLVDKNNAVAEYEKRIDRLKQRLQQRLSIGPSGADMPVTPSGNRRPPIPAPSPKRGAIETPVSAAESLASLIDFTGLLYGRNRSP